MSETFITNPVVVNIGISEYEIENNLDDCKKDIITMNTLWRIYGYSCVYDNLDRPNLTAEQFWEIMEQAKEEFKNKCNNHDAIIISFSGHGGKDSIWFSDYFGDEGKVNINEMQKFVSYPNIRDKTLRNCPRIAIIDACRGQDIVSANTKGIIHPMDNWVALYSNTSGLISKNTPGYGG
eukprot:457892_1